MDCLNSKLQFLVVDNDDDVPSLITLAREAHAESRFGYIPFSADKVAAIAKRAIGDPKQHGIFLATKDDTPLGMLYCSTGEYHIGTDVLLTTIHNINVRRDVRETLSGGRVALGLISGARSWSKARGAEEVLLHVTSGVDLAGSHKFAKRMGFEFVGGSYVGHI